PWATWNALGIFFQAEDGIRDRTVTGVQTCALPICALNESATRYGLYPPDVSTYRRLDVLQGQAIQGNRLLGAFGSNRIVGSPERSEERRVGKERRSRGTRHQ